METEAKVTIKFHNPVVLPGLDVVSQSLEDEKAGKSIDETEQLQIATDSQSHLVNIIDNEGLVVASTDMLTFAANGIIGKRRFTVVVPQVSEEE